MATRTRKYGEFCWFNMLTPRPAEAMAFFGQLLGWEFFEMPGVGHGVRAEGRDVGGLFDLHGPSTPPGCLAMIGVMVKVERADDTARKVNELGGKAQPPFDIGEQGRMSVCFDPNGAQFDIWEPRKMAGTDVDSLAHGAPTWFETLTTDAERATAFYTGLFGWAAQTMPMPDGEYTLFKLDNVPVAGMLKLTPQMAGIPPHWGTYFAVNDVEAAARLAGELGGKVCVPLHDVAGVGRFCGITSPQGVMFFVIQYLRT
jgi:predicted enzyme related to lactoylglutathione lyase